eukprot:1130452-Rhodomonas_salina.3
MTAEALGHRSQEARNRLHEAQEELRRAQLIVQVPSPSSGGHAVSETDAAMPLPGSRKGIGPGRGQRWRRSDYCDGHDSCSQSCHCRQGHFLPSHFTRYLPCLSARCDPHV